MLLRSISAACCRFRPQRSLYVALGHDEEVGGTFGATNIVERLQAEGVQVITHHHICMGPWLQAASRSLASIAPAVQWPGFIWPAVVTCAAGGGSR